MSIVVSGIALPIESDPKEALAIAKKKLNITADCEMSIVRRSVDARKKPHIKFVYSVSANTGDAQFEQQLIRRCSDPNITTREQPGLVIERAEQGESCRPVIAGFGPAGMFCALLLAREGYRPIVLERGGDMDSRVAAVERFWSKGELCGECNIQFGEGGAGTFSDGKLTTRIGDPRCSYVLAELNRFGAPDSILTEAKPHIGTDLLRGVIKNIRNEINSLGGKVIFNCCLKEVAESGGGCRIKTSDGQELETKALVLAIGHSARDTVQDLFGSGLQLIPKAFSCGVRIEQKQTVIDKAMYGSAAGHPALPPAEYQFSKRRNDRGVYTFCMCPGGQVVAAASEAGGVVVNGMSNSLRNGENANSAVVVSIGPEDFGSGALDGIAFQRKLEKAAFELGGSDYKAPCELAWDFIKGKKPSAISAVSPTYTPGVRVADLGSLFPPVVNEYLKLGLSDFEGKAAGFSSMGAVITGVETRTSSPVRMLRSEQMTALGKSYIYPCGEGAGYAGGIVSAAVDGIKAALSIIKRFSNRKGGVL